MAHDITREQEAVIAHLALTHSSVSVKPQDNGTVRVEAGSRTLILDEDGNTWPEQIGSVPIRIPMALLRRLLGDEIADAAVEKAQTYTYPDHAVGQAVSVDATARILELLDNQARPTHWDKSLEGSR